MQIAVTLSKNDDITFVVLDNSSSSIAATTVLDPIHKLTMQRNGEKPHGTKASSFKRKVVLKAQPKCAYCQESKSTTVDHVIPRSLGGNAVYSNLVGACQSCNLIKGDMLPKEIGLKIKFPGTIWKPYHQAQTTPLDSQWEYVDTINAKTVPVGRTADPHVQVALIIKDSKIVKIILGEDVEMPSPGYLRHLFSRKRLNNSEKNVDHLSPAAC